MDLNQLVVYFVIFLITYIGYTGQYIFYIYFETLNFKSLLFFFIYNILVLVLLYNYYLACTVDPGTVPKDWTPDPDAPYLQVKRSNLKPRYCKTCKVYKPPRTHHCSSCERCVLKMDHHCPWLNNCVGFYNYGHFIRFILYVDITTFLSLYIFISHLIQLFDTSYILAHYREDNTLEMFFLVTNLVLCFPVFICVLFLSLYQIWGVLENTTTIENMEKDKVANLVRQGKVSEVRFPYDLGMLKNLQSVLGKKWYLWLIPQSMVGDGLHFDIKMYEDEEAVQWPPPEYSHKRTKKYSQISSDEEEDEEEGIEVRIDYDEDDGEYLIPLESMVRNSKYYEGLMNKNYGNSDQFDDNDDDDIPLSRTFDRTGPKSYLPN